MLSKDYLTKIILAIFLFIKDGKELKLLIHRALCIDYALVFPIELSACRPNGMARKKQAASATA